MWNICKFKENVWDLISHIQHSLSFLAPFFAATQNQIIQQHQPEKERNNAKSAVEENIYFCWHKLQGPYQSFLSASVNLHSHCLHHITSVPPLKSALLVKFLVAGFLYSS